MNILLFAVMGLLLVLEGLEQRRLRKANERLADELASKDHRLKYCEEHLANITRRNRAAFTGAHVMCRSNEDEPITHGVIVRFEEVSKAKNPLPILMIEATGKEYLCMSAVLPYNEKILKEIEGLSNKEQWERLKEISMVWE